MIGEVKFVGRDAYVCTNNNDTLEKLPRVGFFRQLFIAVRAAIKPWHLDGIRTYCKKHGAL